MFNTFKEMKMKQRVLFSECGTYWYGNTDVQEIIRYKVKGWNVAVDGPDAACWGEGMSDEELLNYLKEYDRSQGTEEITYLPRV
jgi:hypothetical protein